MCRSRVLPKVSDRRPVGVSLGILLLLDSQRAHLLIKWRNAVGIENEMVEASVAAVHSGHPFKASRNQFAKETSFVLPFFSARMMPRSESLAMTLCVFSLEKPASLVMYF